MYAKLSISVDSAGVFMCRPRAVVLGGAGGGADAGATPGSRPTTRQRGAFFRRHFMGLFMRLYLAYPDCFSVLRQLVVGI